MYIRALPEPFPNRIWISSPTMHGGELEFIKLAYDSNWMSCVGENIDAIESIVGAYTGVGSAVALSSGTAALHMALILAGVKCGTRVACSDMSFCATVNPVLYEGGEPVLIDCEPDTWNMAPEALERAFMTFPDIKAVICADLYGVPAKYDEISEICRRNGAVLIEDAAESLGAKYKAAQAGSLGELGTFSFNGNKIITGSAGGMLLTDDSDAAARVRKRSAQSRETAPWYQHEELGYNYRMSNVTAGIVRGQLPQLEEHIRLKKAIYERYRDGFKGLPVSMNPFDAENSEPNFWLSCILIDREAMCPQYLGETEVSFTAEQGKSCPTEILRVLAALNAEGRPIWKPMHMQPLYKKNPFVTKNEGYAVDEDIFSRGLCLPSDIKMTAGEQDRIIEAVRACFE